MGWPKYLKKTYTKEELGKKVLKKVQLAHDKEFLESLFHSEKRGEWILRTDLSKIETKRLKKLVKELKKGKGGVKILPLILLAILAGAIIVFTLFFKNPLTERYLEKSLKSLFGATVDIDGLNLSLVKTSLELEHLAITDETKLDYNLIELGSTRISFNGRALLQKKYVIESLECRDILWDRKRETPGELYSGKDGKAAASRDINLLPFMEEHGGSTVNNITQAAQDPKAFVQDQWENLKTPAAAREMSAEYEKLFPEQKSKMSELQNSGEKVRIRGEEFLNRDFNRYLDNPSEIPQLIKEGDDYKNQLAAVSSQIRSELDSLDALRQSLDRDRNELLLLKDNDYEQLSSLISLPQGGVEGIFKGIVQSYIASLLGDRYAKAMTLWGYVRKYRQDSANKEKDPADSQGRRSGRVVSFDSTLWPDFILQEGSFSATQGDLSWDGQVLDMAGDPKKWKNPAALSFSLLKGEGKGEGEGLIDLREERESPSEGNIVFAGLPLTSDALSSLGISQFSGSAGGNTQITVNDQAWLVDTSLVLTDTQLVKGEGDQMADLIYPILSSEDWEMGISLKGEGDQFDFGLDWPLLSRVDDQIGAFLQDQADEFLIQVQEELKTRFAGEWDFLDQYSVDTDSYSNILKGDLSSLDKQKEEVNRNIEDVKTKAASQASDRTNEVLESTGAKEAVENVGNTLKSLF